MKVLILAGGYATRLWPITKKKAKPLLPLGGKPILDYILDELENISNVEKIYLTTNEQFRDSFKKYLSQRKKENYELIIEKQESEGEKYGAVGGMINVIGEKEPDDYLIIGGDNYYSFKIRDFLKFVDEKGNIANACYRVKSLEEAKNYGIVDYDENNRIIDFQEKPDNPKSRMASTACYYIPENRLSIFDKYVDYWEGRVPEEVYLDEPGRFIEWIVERYDTYAFVFEGDWVDIGTREGYLRAESEIRKEKVIQGDITDSEIGENVTILEGTQIKNCEIENSIIFEDCRIKDSIIKDSLIGNNTELTGKDLREGLIKDMD